MLHFNLIDEANKLRNVINSEPPTNAILCNDDDLNNMPFKPTAPQPLPVEVKIPVAVSCIKPEQIPVKPDYQSLSDNDNTPDGTVILHVTRDLAKSLPYQQQLEAVIGACR